MQAVWRGLASLTRNVIFRYRVLGSAEGHRAHCIGAHHAVACTAAERTTLEPQASSVTDVQRTRRRKREPVTAMPTWFAASEPSSRPSVLQTAAEEQVSDGSCARFGAAAGRSFAISALALAHANDSSCIGPVRMQLFSTRCRRAMECDFQRSAGS